MDGKVLCKWGRVGGGALQAGEVRVVIQETETEATEEERN